MNNESMNKYSNVFFIETNIKITQQFYKIINTILRIFFI